MLSFLQEQGPGGPGKHEPGTKQAGAQSREDISMRQSHKGETLPDTNSAEPVKPAQEQDYLTVAVQDKHVRKTTYLLCILFGIGLLSLWFMIKKSTPARASAATVSAQETQIEQAITQLIGAKSEMSGSMGKIVEKFYEFSDVQQVGVGELSKNPFKQDIFLGNGIQKSDTGSKIPSIDVELLKQEKDMQLLSIMRAGQADATRSCMIGDEIFREGDSIKGFKVSQISDNFVKLQKGDVEVVLTLTE